MYMASTLILLETCNTIATLHHKTPNTKYSSIKNWNKNQVKI